MDGKEKIWQKKESFVGISRHERAPSFLRCTLMGNYNPLYRWESEETCSAVVCDRRRRNTQSSHFELTERRRHVVDTPTTTLRYREWGKKAAAAKQKTSIEFLIILSKCMVEVYLISQMDFLSFSISTPSYSMGYIYTPLEHVVFVTLCVRFQFNILFSLIGWTER